jgi:hypothetical protein
MQFDRRRMSLSPMSGDFSGNPGAIECGLHPLGTAQPGGPVEVPGHDSSVWKRMIPGDCLNDPGNWKEMVCRFHL